MPLKVNKRLKIFTFDELGKDAKETAIADYREDMYQDPFYSEQVTDDLKEIMGWAGIEDMELGWSLSCCQGDGVAFWGSVSFQDLLEAQAVLAEQVKFKRWVYTRKFSGSRTVFADGCCYSQLIPGNRFEIETEHIAVDGQYVDRSTIRQVTGDSGNLILKRWVEDAGNFKLQYVSSDSLSDELVETFKKLLLADVTQELIRDELLGNEVDITFTVTHSGNYYHWNSMSVSLGDDGYGLAENLTGQAKAVAVKVLDEALKTVETDLDEWVKDVSKVLERCGYECLENTYSDENISEILRDSDFAFDEDGDRLPDCDEILARRRRSPVPPRTRRKVLRLNKETK